MNKHELNEEDTKGTKYTSKKKIEQKNKRSFKQRITQSSAEKSIINYQITHKQD